MGFACYYVGVKKHDKEFVKEMAQTMLEAEPFVRFIDDVVEFKQPIPSGWLWEEGYTETFTAEENEVFLVFQGNRHALNEFLDELNTELIASHHYVRFVDTDMLDVSLYLEEFEEKENQKPFENEFVKIY